MTTPSSPNCRGFTAISKRSSRTTARLPEGHLPSFLRMGSWIGSDRDGNPFVTEEVLRAALRAQSSRALQHYLEELHLLGGELSLDSRLVGVSGELRRWPRARPTDPPIGSTNPIGGQSPGSMRGWRQRHASSIISTLSQHAVGDAPPYRDSAELLADLAVLDASLVEQWLRDACQGSLAEFAPRHRCFRLSSCRARSSPEFRCARAHGRRDAEPRAAGSRLCRACRARAHQAASRGTADGAPAGVFVSPLFGRDEERTRDPDRDRRRASALRAGFGAALRDLEGRPASPTFWKPPCC